MFVDCSKLPDPHSPLEDDVYTSLDGRHTLVVTNVPEHAFEDESRPPSAVIGFVLNGLTNACPQGHLPAIVASIGARPWGRLDRSNKARPTISRDPEIVAERLAAIGPHVRALREQHGLSMGDLARALGCPPARLSMLELGEPDPVREGAGVREDEGAAALTELLAEAAVTAFFGFKADAGAQIPDPAKAAVWEALFVMLTTAPAHAAMSTILKARGEVETAANPGTSAMDLSNLNPETAAARVVAMLVNDGLLPDRTEDGLRDKLIKGLVNTLSRLKPAPTPAEPECVGTFIVGDRVQYKDMFGKIAELDDALQSARIVTESAKLSTIVPLAELGLANDDTATQTARAGLALLLATELARVGPTTTIGSEADAYAGMIEPALRTDEAQRLIRLHG